MSERRYNDKEIAAQFPWARTGCVEVRPVRDIETVRRRITVSAS